MEEREERLDPTFYRLMKTFMRGSYEESFQGSGTDLFFASHEDKMCRLTSIGKSRAEARAPHSNGRRGARRLCEKVFGKTWPQRDLYHLMLNSGMGDHNVIETILNSVALLNQQNPAAVHA